MKIGSFAKLSGVSIKTLRFYDSMGLLKPANVEDHSGYRYYTEEQLLTIKRIKALKEQCFKLDQIKKLLEPSSPNEVKGTLIDHKEELERTLDDMRQRLNEINQKLVRIDELEHYDTSAKNIRRVRPQLAAIIRDSIPRSQICLLLDEIIHYTGDHGENAGNSLTILWYETSANPNKPNDVAVALPLSKEIPGSDRVRIDYLPEWVQAASFIHYCDPYSNTCCALQELMIWISSQGYAADKQQPIRETYLTSDKDMYGTLRLAELLVPLKVTK